jgi:aubergine-like protein
MLSTSSALPQHPAYENTYRQVSLQTNQFSISAPEAQKVFLYTLTFFPPIPSDNTQLKKALIRGSRSDLSRYLGRFIHCGENLYSVKELFQEVSSSTGDDNSSSSNEFLKVNHQHDDSNYEITVIPSGEVDLNDFRKLGSVMQICNISLRNKLKLLHLIQLGSMRNHYDPTASKSLPGFPACVWPGFFTSVNLLRAGAMLTIDCSFKLVRTDNLLEVINEMMSKNNSREQIRNELFNKIIMTFYGSQATYRVEDVLFDESPVDKFQFGCTEITYVKYFKDKYQANVNYRSQPLILARRNLRTPSVKLVPELCRMTGAGSLSENMKLKKEISVFTRMRPEKRQADIQGLASRLSRVNEPQWGMTNSTVPVSVRALQLPFPKIITGQKPIQTNEKASFQLRECRPVKSVPLDRWQLFFIEKDQGLALDLVKSLQNISASFGQMIASPISVPVPGGRDMVKTFAAALNEKVNLKAQLVAVILPRNLQHAYRAIKSALTTEKPVPSQVVMTSSLERRDLSVISKILVQIMCKIGATPWTVSLPQGLNSKTMLVGIDVCHNSFTAKKSVLGFCASLDQNFTRYFSKAAIHDVGQEISDVLTPLFLESLKHFYAANGKSKPENIVIYRDGVGTSQYNEVVSKEIPQLVDAIRAFDRTWKPQIVVIIVNKRVNQRFFLNGANPGPGLLVDKEIVWDHFNFYLMSHAVNIGCMTPTHYNVVVNDSSIPVTTLYELTYNLCYMYFNWQGGIRAPAPCMYAHKIAYLIGKHTGQLFDSRLSSTFFYL